MDDRCDDPSQPPDVPETGLLPDTQLQVDLRVGQCAASGCTNVVIVVDGIPTSASTQAVVASILGSLQAALGARLVEQELARSH